MLSKHCRATAAGQHHLKHTLLSASIDLFTNKQGSWDRQLERGRHDIGISLHFSPSPGCAGDGLNRGEERGWGWQPNALLLKDGAHGAPLLPTMPISHVMPRGRNLNSLHPWKPLDVLLCITLLKAKVKTCLRKPCPYSGLGNKIWQLDPIPPLHMGHRVTEHHKVCSSISTLGYCGTSVRS